MNLLPFVLSGTCEVFYMYMYLCVWYAHVTSCTCTLYMYKYVPNGTIIPRYHNSMFIVIDMIVQLAILHL